MLRIGSKYYSLFWALVGSFPLEKWLVRNFQFELWEVVLDDKDFSLNFFNYDLGRLRFALG